MRLNENFKIHMRLKSIMLWIVYIITNQKNISEYNLLHDMINPPKRTKHLNIHYSPILHGCMNNGKGKVKFKNFRILLDSVCSSTIVMRQIF